MKISITVTTDPRPFLVQVAVPIENDRYTTYSFSLLRDIDVTALVMDYFYEAGKDGEGILEYHKDKVREHESKMSSPFFFDY